MTTPENALTEEERKLLKAAVAHANANPSDCHVRIDRILYGFRTNLTEYAEVVTEPADKEKWETSLKCLISQDLLRHVSAGNQSWTYAVTDKGFAAAE
ncbi:hypothetical protein ACPOL_7170 (plasmid) [Acidisarcina polymorpha]|uniref:Uncharacterized protein n=1 Tax=Acidisarcina polymorpha TaxID=2211140 RepID=A0A2Z5GAT5_9BACT|nr:hypothetical protein [Acidisarcina polymorpha]AXC16362.1 hypothetical protein ACPOL_7170 [Acidisarcina polymorpha]